MDELIRCILLGTHPQQFSGLTEAILLRKPLSGRGLRVVTENLPPSLICEVLEISKPQLSKLYAKTLSRAQTEQISSLAKLWINLEEFFNGDRDMLDSWLDDPIPVLGGVPRDLISTFAGRRAVEDYIGRVRYGDLSL